MSEVIDGNTVVLSNRTYNGLTFGSSTCVVLDAMVAPALDQPGGDEAKVRLIKLLSPGQEVIVIDYISGGKSLGAWIFIGDEEICVNTVMIQEGMAWLKEPKASLAVSSGKPKQAWEKMKEEFPKAKASKRGLWADEKPIPPWEWRQQRGTESVEPSRKDT